ncbi:MAG: hypothetical protein ACTS6P_01790 [Candidatus Hodgkinia cicadicola]
MLNRCGSLSEMLTLPRRSRKRWNFALIVKLMSFANFALLDWFAKLT